MDGILLSRLDWCPQLLLGIFRQAIKTNMQDFCTFSCSTSLEPLAHHRNVASLTLFNRYYFGRYSSELTRLVSFPFSHGRSTHYSDRLLDFSVTIPRCYKDIYVNSSFPGTARLWNCLPIECFPLTYNLNGFKFCVRCICASLFFKSK